MAEKKKQHYVPQFYLKRFSNNLLFHIYNVEKQEDIGNYSYKDQCYEDYYYGKNKIWENKLSTLEEKWSCSFDNIMGSNQEYSNIDVDNLREFAIYQHIRTRSYMEEVKRKIANRKRTCLEFESRHTNIDYNDEIVEKWVESVTQNVAAPGDILNALESSKDSVLDLAFMRIHYRTNKKLISSDNPILVINPYTPFNIGLETIGLMIIFPMSPSDLGVFFDKKIYTVNKQCFIESHDQSEVNHINALMYANADEIIYSINKFDNIILSDNNRRLRDNNKKQSDSEVQFFKNDLFIKETQHTIHHNFNIHFCKINSKFELIPQELREPVPRKYNKGAEKKLIIKYQDEYLNCFFKSDPYKKEKYRGVFKNYYNIVNEYWNC